MIWEGQTEKLKDDSNGLYFLILHGECLGRAGVLLARAGLQNWTNTLTWLQRVVASRRLLSTFLQALASPHPQSINSFTCDLITDILGLGQLCYYFLIFYDHLIYFMLLCSPSPAFFWYFYYSILYVLLSLEYKFLCFLFLSDYSESKTCINFLPSTSY